MQWEDWLPALISSGTVAVLASAVVYVGRDIVKAGIEKRIQHKFDQQIETVRTNLRQTEEQFKSDLRAKEVEISALRNGALTALTTRQTSLDKRRLEAAERIWSSVATMSVIKIDAMAKLAAREPTIQQMFQVLGKGYDLNNRPNDPAKYERPFVTDAVWALWSAYQLAVLYPVAQMKLVELGLDNPREAMNEENAKKVMKAALPHLAAYIDQHGPVAFYYLLEELELKLIAALREMLEGAEVDQATVAQSASIMKAIDAVVGEMGTLRVNAIAASQN
jgi:hypothetical protein